MKKYYFLKKDFGYYFTIFFCCCLSILFCVFAILSLLSNLKLLDKLGGCLFFMIYLLVFSCLCIIVIKNHNKYYIINDGKIKYDGPFDFSDIANSLGSKIKKNCKNNSVIVSEISYCFITEYVCNTKGFIPQKEKINGKSQIMGYMFLLNKFVYDKHRCSNLAVFVGLNKNKDFKSENYKTLCSMFFQEEVLNEIYKNGFQGEIYISSTVYEPRKNSFDLIFLKNNVSKEKIHIF